MKKIIFTGILFLGLTMAGFAQSDKMKEKASEKVEELNSEIIAADESLALSTVQKKEIYNLHVERLMELRKVKKDGGDEDVKKAVNKKYFQKIYKDILTKEQRQAKKEGKAED